MNESIFLQFGEIFMWRRAKQREDGRIKRRSPLDYDRGADNEMRYSYSLDDALTILLFMIAGVFEVVEKWTCDRSRRPVKQNGKRM